MKHVLQSAFAGLACAGLALLPPACSPSEAKSTRTGGHVAVAHGTPSSAAPAAAITDIPSAVRDRLLKVGAEYHAWGRVDDVLRWAPELCMVPPPSRPRFSESDDAATHGRKLYFLFAADREEYVAMSDGAPASTGQIIVKESWLPEEDDPPMTDADGRTLRPEYRGAQWEVTGEHVDHFTTYLQRDGRWYRADAKGPLFVMMKAGPGPGTDNGWIYATLTPEGSEITAAGRIESCMKCHEHAPHDRLFGLGYAGKAGASASTTREASKDTR